MCQADVLTTFKSPIVLKSGSFKLLEPLELDQNCTGIALPFYICAKLSLEHGEDMG
jgi:hypothetical protein